MDQQQPCIIMFPTGAMIVEYRHDPQVWVEFNKTARPNCALFVSKVLKHPGDQMTSEQAQALFNDRWRLT